MVVRRKPSSSKPKSGWNSWINISWGPKLQSGRSHFYILSRWVVQAFQVLLFIMPKNAKQKHRGFIVHILLHLHNYDA